MQNLHFHTDELTAGTTTPLLKLGTTTKDIRGLNIGVDRSGDAPKLKKGDKLLLMKTAGSLTTDDKIENKIEGKQGMGAGDLLAHDGVRGLRLGRTISEFLKRTDYCINVV